MSQREPELKQQESKSSPVAEQAEQDNHSYQEQAARRIPSPRSVTSLVLLICIGLFAFYLVADRVIPNTDMARVRGGNVIPLAPLVSGEVTKVNVAPNDLVQTGDPLLQIDPTDYQIALRKAEQGAGGGREADWRTDCIGGSCTGQVV